jgi:hypothetical protein
MVCAYIVGPRATQQRKERKEKEKKKNFIAGYTQEKRQKKSKTENEERNISENSKNMMPHASA